MATQKKSLSVSKFAIGVITKMITLKNATILLANKLKINYVQAKNKIVNEANKQKMRIFKELQREKRTQQALGKFSDRVLGSGFYKRVTKQKK